jgi:phage terminase large subunit
MEQQSTAPLRIKMPPFYRFMVEPHRYKSVHGGRGSARSWTFARLLGAMATERKLRILCTREYQTSMKESVHQLLTDQIWQMQLNRKYTVTRDSIRSDIGSEFIFKGLRANPMEIKSLEGIDICWNEEAQSTSNQSWEILIPTIRKDNSEIWLSWNTGEVNDPTYQRFVANPPDDCISKKATYRDNPYFPLVLEKERLYLQRVDADAYDHVWEGNPKSISDACVFKNKYVVEEFETPENMRFFHGADFGFSNDPSTLIRSYIYNGDLWIDYEAYGVGVEIDELPQLYSVVPTYKEWKIYADSARPDTISHLKNKHHLTIESCDKGKGSVEDGIAYLRKYPTIHIHQRCKHMAEEAKLYAWKQDIKTQEVLPILIDKHNHCWDALRYGHCKQMKGAFSWADVVGD